MIASSVTMLPQALTYWTWKDDTVARPAKLSLGLYRKALAFNDFSDLLVFFENGKVSRNHKTQL